MACTVELIAPRPRRVLFVLAGLGGGGAERVMVTILRHLDRSRFEPHLGLVDCVGPYLDEVPGDVPVHDLRAGRARYAIPSIVWLVWKLRPSLVVSTLGYLNLVLILAKPFLPSATKLLVREGIIVSAQLAQDVEHPRAWRWLYRCLYKRSDTIICQSECMLKDLSEQFQIPTGKMVQIYNPVDIKKIQELAEAAEDPYSGQGPHLVTAGRLSRQKGFDLLLEAMVSVLKAFPQAQLSILGQGKLESALKAQRDQLGLAESVHFVGFKSNPFPYFEHADLFVLPSRYEGLPNVVLEALTLGVPVLANEDAGGIREIARHSEGVKLADMCNPMLLAKGIIDNLREARVGFTPGCSDAFVRAFGVESVMAQYEGLLAKVVDSSP